MLEIYVEGSKITMGNEFKTENWCYGITAYKDGLLITVGTKLKYIDVNSKFIKNIIHSKIGESQFGSPCYLKVVKGDNILISDSLKHTLYCIDENGGELFRYNEMRHPHGSAIVNKDTMCLAGNLDTVDDFNTRNKCLTAKLLKQGYRYHKLRKSFSKFYRQHYELISKFNVGLKSLLHQGQSETEFYGDLVYKFKKIRGMTDFSDQFRKNIMRYKGIGYNLNVMRQSNFMWSLLGKGERKFV